MLLSERKLHEAIVEKEKLHEKCSKEHVKDNSYIRSGYTDKLNERKNYIAEQDINLEAKGGKVHVKLEIDHELGTLDDWNLEPDCDVSEDSD